MFQRLGSWIAKHPFPIIAAWIVGAIVLTLVAPGLDQVFSSDQSDFSPEDAPLVHAQEVQASVFPEQSAASGSMVVVDNGHGS